MPDSIDYAFIGGLEGSELRGYVPAADRSRSGVTIATGFDLGQRNAVELKRLGLPQALIDKLTPYLGLKGQDAISAIQVQPLEISRTEGTTIDQAVKKDHMGRLAAKYRVAAGNRRKVSFDQLPAAAQTAIASVSFQYGVNLDASAPKFWRAATQQNWKECHRILVTFGDAYPTRRRKEAALMQSIAK